MLGYCAIVARSAGRPTVSRSHPVLVKLNVNIAGSRPHSKDVAFTITDLDAIWIASSTIDGVVLGRAVERLVVRAVQVYIIDLHEGRNGLTVDVRESAWWK